MRSDLARATRSGRLKGVLFGLILGLTVVEGGLRWRDGRLFSLENVIYSGRIPANARFDELVGWRPREGHFSSITRTSTLGGVRRIYDVVLDHGIRSNGAPAPKQGPVILAVGNSFTWGEEVADHETWPAQLERALDTPVLNAGVSGFGIDQAVLRAEHLLDILQADCLILGLIPECIERCELSHRESDKPYFEVTDSGLRLHNVPVVQTYPPLGPLRGILGYSFLAHTIMAALDPEGWYITKREHDRGLEVSRLLMERLARLSKERSIPVIVLALYDRGAKESVIPLLFPDAPRDLHIIDLIDLESEYAKLDPDKVGPLRMIFRHFSPLGNRLIAREIAHIVKRRGLLEEL